MANLFDRNYAAANKTSFEQIEDIARKTRVPVNVLIAMGERAKVEKPEDLVEFSRTAANELAPALQAGGDIQQIIRDNAGDQADSFLARAREIGMELYPDRMNAGQAQRNAEAAAQGRRSIGENIALGAPQLAEGWISGAGYKLKALGLDDAGQRLVDFAQSQFGLSEEEQARSQAIALESTIGQEIVDGFYQALIGIGVDVGVSAAGAKTGAKIGAIAGPKGALAGGLIGAFTGAAISIYPQMVASAWQRAEQNGADMDDPDEQYRALGTGALTSIAQIALPGAAGYFLTRPVTAAATGIGRNIAGNIGKAGAFAAMTEGSAEALAVIIEAVRHDKDLRAAMSDEDYAAILPLMLEKEGRNIIVAGGIGALMGGGIGGATGGIDAARVNAKVNADQSNIHPLFEGIWDEATSLNAGDAPGIPAQDHQAFMRGVLNELNGAEFALSQDADADPTQGRSAREQRAYEKGVSWARERGAEVADGAKARAEAETAEAIAQAEVGEAAQQAPLSAAIDERAGTDEQDPMAPPAPRPGTLSYAALEGARRAPQPDTGAVATGNTRVLEVGGEVQTTVQMRDGNDVFEITIPGRPTQERIDQAVRQYNASRENTGAELGVSPPAGMPGGEPQASEVSAVAAAPQDGTTGQPVPVIAQFDGDPAPFDAEIVSESAEGVQIMDIDTVANEFGEGEDLRAIRQKLERYIEQQEAQQRDAEAAQQAEDSLIEEPEADGAESADTPPLGELGAGSQGAPDAATQPDIIAKPNGAPYASRDALRLKVLEYKGGLDAYEITERDGGFVAVRKADAAPVTPDVQQIAQQDRQPSRIVGADPAEQAQAEARARLKRVAQIADTLPPEQRSIYDQMVKEAQDTDDNVSAVRAGVLAEFTGRDDDVLQPASRDSKKRMDQARKVARERLSTTPTEGEQTDGIQQGQQEGLQQQGREEEVAATQGLDGLSDAENAELADLEAQFQAGVAPKTSSPSPKKPVTLAQQRTPLTNAIIGLGGIAPTRVDAATGETVRTKAAGELANRGITPKTHPRLFSADGRTDLDNIDPASIHEDMRFITGVDDTGNYLDQDALYDAIASETGPNAKPFHISYEDRGGYEALEVARDRRARGLDSTIDEDRGDRTITPRTQDDAGDRARTNRITKALDEVIKAKNFPVTEREKSAIIERLYIEGGMVEEAIVDELVRSEMNKVSDKDRKQYAPKLTRQQKRLLAEIPFGDEPTPATAQSEQGAESGNQSQAGRDPEVDQGRGSGRSGNNDRGPDQGVTDTVPTPEEFDRAAQETDPDPTPAQAEAENYKTGKIEWRGLRLSIENREGTERKGVDKNGNAWSVIMPAHYGRILGTTGADADHVDFYMGDDTFSDRVFVVDQRDAETDSFDEHKVMLGFANQQRAKQAFLAAFNDGKGRDRWGGVTGMTVDKFLELIEDPEVWKKPLRPVQRDLQQQATGRTEVDYPNRKLNMRKAAADAPIDGIGDSSDMSLGMVALANAREGDVLPNVGRISKVTEKQIQITRPDGSVLRHSANSPRLQALARDMGGLIASSANLRPVQLESLMDMIERDPALTYRDGVPQLFDDPAEQANKGDRGGRQSILRNMTQAAQPAPTTETAEPQTERTEAGIQNVMPGMDSAPPAPTRSGMTDRQRAELAARQQQSKMRRLDGSTGDAGPLFDDQGDMFSAAPEPAKPKARFPTTLQDIARRPREGEGRLNHIYAEFGGGRYYLASVPGNPEGPMSAWLESLPDGARILSTDRYDGTSINGAETELRAAMEAKAEPSVETPVKPDQSAAIETALSRIEAEGRGKKIADDFRSALAREKDDLADMRKTQAKSKDGSIYNDDIALVEARIADFEDRILSEAEAIPPNTKTRPKGTKAQRERAAFVDRIEKHYTPGNIVNSYGGKHDRVISFNRPESGDWSVTVQSVVRDGDDWVAEAGARERTHSTLPSERELRAGPVQVAQEVPAPKKALKGLSEAENAELAALEAQFLDKFRGQTSSGLDPEMVSIALKIGNLYVRAGRRRFRDLIQTMMERMGLPLERAQPYARNAYNQIRDDMDLAGDDVSDMDSSQDVMAEIRKMRAEESRKAAQSATVEGAETESDADVSDTSGNLEPSRGSEPGDGLGAESVPPAATPDRSGTGSQRAGASRSGRRAIGDQRIPTNDAASMGAGSDSAAGSPAANAGAGVDQRGDGRGSDTDGQPRQADDGARRAGAQSASGDSPDLKARLAAQKATDRANKPVVLADPENIADTLPLLFESQHEDVLKAETRFQAENGHGMMFTNGTGTGKTFTGLGVVKRFALQGKDSILIVAPTQGIMSNWVKSAEALNLNVSRLEDTKDAGRGIVITTYANLGENTALAARDFDLIVADESHNLMSSADAKPTAALDHFRAISGHPSGLTTRAYMLEAKMHAEVKALRAEIEANRKSDDERRWQANAGLEKQFDALYTRFTGKINAHKERLAQKPRSKAVFLSATPFAYDKNVDYAEGYLFDYPRSENRGGYNVAEGRDAFMVQNFGYRMRYNKLTRPEGEVNSGVMERQFHEKLKADGALSARVLDVDADYSRAFALIEDSKTESMALGQQIDRAVDLLWSGEENRYLALHEFVTKRFDYLTRMRLLEAIKAEAAIDMIKADLALNRKVVVFHDYNTGGGIKIFDTSEMPSDAVRDEYHQFRAENPWIDDLDFSGMRSPIETLKDNFPNALLYNGRETKKAREEAKRLFNEDESGFDLIVVQSAAGEAGISLHDTTGKHQRVLINLGMPTRPTTAIQEEGRIYRVGQVTNAVFRYLNTGTDWERFTFAQRIAERASTAENLAMGEQARALKESFIDAFGESEAVIPGDQEGTGGKGRDRVDNSISPYERAKTFYFAQQRTQGRRNTREGIDYYATPEPVGFKMVELADIKPGEKVLEPSAGHGAIARFFPENANSTIVEPEMSLLSRAMLAQSNARSEQVRFEDLHVANKYDAIVMNPPYGTGGKTAMEHVAKAMKHLRNGGRIVALIPEGPSANKRYDAMMEGADAKDFYEVAEVKLPSATFGRAGTSVKTRIVVIEKHTDAEVVKTLNHQRRDYDSVENVNDLFDRMEDMTINARREPLTKDEDVEVYDARGKVTLDGHKITYTPDAVKITSRLQKPMFAAMAKEAEKHSGFYDRADKAFSFPDMEARDNFLEAVRKGVEPAAPDESGRSSFTLAETTHAKKGIQLFVASMDARVSPDEFNRLRNLAKANGGYWSAYTKMGAIPGFQFESAEERAAFMDLAQVQESESRFDAEPVATLRGDELGEWSDIRQLGRKVEAWYRDNLIGKAVTNAATGMEVQFRREGARKVSGRKGDVLMRIVPALSDIIQKGIVTNTEPDAKGSADVKAWHTISATVSLDGQPRDVVVKIKETSDGKFHYDLSRDMSDGARHSVASGRDREAAIGLEDNPADVNLDFAGDSVNAEAADPALTPAATRDVTRAVNAELRRSIPNSKVTAKVVRGLANAAGAPIQGRQRGAQIEVNPDSADGVIGTLRHEIVHALRDAGLWGQPYGLFTRAEWQGLVAAARADKALMARIDRMYPDLGQSARLEEGVAELYRLWARNMDQRSGLDRAFQKMRALFQALASAFRGQGFNSTAQTFERIASGAVGGRGPDGPSGQGSPSDSRNKQDQFAAQFLSELAATDDIFVSPRATSTSLEGVFAEIDPSVSFFGDATQSDEASESGADRRFLLRTNKGRDLYVFETDDSVWFDVSRLEPGEAGSRVYSAVADYALNNRKEFIGDPAGLSDEALRRRTEAMLSSAIKHGTTDHLAPHQRQIEGDAALGVPPLKWTPGDTEGNVKSLINVSIESLAHHVPEFRRARYDFQTGTFRTGEGKPIPDAVLKVWTEHPRVRAAGAGRRTLKRGILLNSLAHAEGSQRPGLLEQALRQQRQLVSGLRGTFYSRFDPARRPDGRFASKAAQYSRQLLGDGGKITGAKERGLLGNLLTDAMGGKSDRYNVLALVPGEPLFQEMGKHIPSAQKYLKMKHALSAMRNEMQAEASKFMDQWRGFARKNSQANDRMMALMHDATLRGVDPAERFTMRPRRTNEGKASYAAEVEAKRLQHEELKKRFDRLPKEARDIYRGVRDGYKEMSRLERQIIMDNVAKAMEINVKRAQQKYDDTIRELDEDGITGDERAEKVEIAKQALMQVKKRDGYDRKARLQSLRLMFEQNEVEAPYFPLMRHGNYYATVKNDAGQILSFSKFETERARDQAVAQLKRDFPEHEIKAGAMSSKDSRPPEVDPNFMADVQAMIGATSADTQLMDSIWQRYLETLPDFSIRKSRIHRKGTPGYSADAFRNYAKQMFHGAFQLSRLKYGQDMQLAIEDAQREAQEANDPTRSTLVVNEMEKRHQWIMNPQTSAWSTWATSAAFVYYLGATPAAAMVNLSQSVIVGMPVMAAAFEKGTIADAGRHLMRGLREFSMAKGRLLNSKHLKPDEKEALQRAYDAGVIEKSQAHDLAGMQESGVEYSDVRQRMMRPIAYLFHHSERMNREITFMAAYRMAKESGQVGDTAYTNAARLTWKSHFNYESDSRPRLQFNDTVRVATVFRNYQLNMLYRLFRDTHQMMQGETEADRKEARAQLIGITGMMMLMAGFTGTWGYALMTTLLGLFKDGGADEVEEEIKEALVNTLGVDVAGMILKGVPGHLSGIDLPNRIGMPELWFRRPQRQEEGAELYDHWFEQLVGAVPAMGSSIFRGGSMVMEGEIYRGIETAAPKFVRDYMRSYRYTTDGVTTLRGNPIIEDISPREALTQAIGFTPARISERYQTNRFMKNEEMRIRDQRTRLMAQAYADIKDGKPLSDRTKQAIASFNAEYPTYPITADTLRQSFRSRARGEIETVDGVRINNRLDQIIREGRAPMLYN